MKKLYRSRRDKKLFGLCGGIAEMLNVDATLLRILLIVLTVFTSGALILIYILAGMVVPKEPPSYDPFGPYGHNGYNGYNGGPYNGGGYNGNYNGGFGAPPPNYGRQANRNQYGGPYTGTPPRPEPSDGFNNWQQGQASGAPKQAASNLDAMMDDLEKKAMRKEIDELRAKLAKQEKGEE
ncbi:PspC domain-containing protein [Paenibacillus sp. GCM10027626]|uniref:PspC domain-containing protein n=1 Tax=Paenibacillus sp. GCM10027626 TaxID=3273411 RepID=UPI003644249E